MRKEIIPIAFAMTIAILATQATATKLTIEIVPIIKETTFFFNYTDPINQTAQQFWTYWENRGSVGCINRLRVDIYNRSLNAIGKDIQGHIDPLNETNQRRRIYTAWSKSETYQPGTNADMYAYFVPLNISGNFSAQARVYSCNEIFYIEPFQFEVAEMMEETEPTELFEKITIKNIDKNHISITVIPKDDMNKTTAFPEEHIEGWIIESAEFGKMTKGVEYTQTIFYEAPIWIQTNITIGISANDGKQYVRKEFTIDEIDQGCQYSIKDTTIAIIIIIMVFAAVYLKRMNRRNNERTKDQDSDKNTKKQSHKTADIKP